MHFFIVENRVINQDVRIGEDKSKRGTVTFSEVYKKIPHQVRLHFLSSLCNVIRIMEVE